MTADRARKILNDNADCEELRALVLGDDIPQAMRELRSADTPVTLREAQAAIQAVGVTNAERMLTSFV